MAVAPVPAPVIHRVTTLDLKLRPWRWAFADERRVEIDAHFAAKQAEKPELWNGVVLLGRNLAFTPECCSAEYFEADFASFLAWRDWGFPDQTVFNGFGMGALRGRDGGFVLGEMGAQTANAGRVYFASGTPDRGDISGDRVDIAASVGREVQEETGLAAADYTAADHWHCVVSGRAVAMIRLLQLDQDGEAACAAIRANLARQPSPELSGVRLVRDAADFTAAMPAFVTAYIAHLTETRA